CTKVVKDENDAVVDMEIIVKFGTKVQKVATEVQERVKSTVETMTGLNVAVVNVSVSGVVKEVKAEEEE
ncbi:MAG: Asp23/Gls24 family envelope stress response protein, partial [Anaerotignum sp.]|nr:Asp23/Gls24 family envelope stress response protein [Anaerotignum sp.]